MNDVAVRTRNVEETPKAENIVGKEVVTDTVHEEVPYTDYKAENGKPYLADHYKLGDTWEVFNEEISTIEDYVKRRMESGEMANSTKAVKDLIKSMEKMHNLKNEERTVVKLGVLASYVKFLNESEGYRFNWRKYND